MMHSAVIIILIYKFVSLFSIFVTQGTSLNCVDMTLSTKQLMEQINKP